MPKTFTAKLATRGKRTWLVVPASVAKAFDSPGRVMLQGTINDFPFRASLFHRPDGAHYILINSEMRQGAKARPGDAVKVALERSSALRHVVVPADFQRALAKSGRAQANFEKLAPSHQREYIDHLARAISPKTRKLRIEQMIEMLLAAKKQQSK
jgi:hypothetical protein